LTRSSLSVSDPEELRGRSGGPSVSASDSSSESSVNSGLCWSRL